MKMMNWLGSVALTLVILSGLAVPALAQDDDLKVGIWQKDLELGVNILQSSYSQNWKGGEKGSMVWTGNFDARLEKQFTERTNWRNTLKLTYGQTHNQERNESGDLYWKKPDKTDDIIDLESLFRWTPQSGWDPYISFNFTSMFEDISDVEGRPINFNPLTFKEGVGISRPWVKTEDRYLMSRLGLAFIQNSRSFFLESGPDAATERKGSLEMAAELITEYKTKALDGAIDWESKLTLILPFAYSGKSIIEDEIDLEAYGLPDDLASYTTTLDVDWENTFNANITKVISVKLFIRWVYDKYDNTVTPLVENGDVVNIADVQNAIRKAGQFKQTLALGFSYKFM